MDDYCNEKNFSVFFEIQFKKLKNYLHFKYKNEETAIDVAQEAFIKLWQNCSKVTQETAKSFLYTVANNKYLNELAHQKIVLKYEQTAVVSSTNSEDPSFFMEESEFEDKLSNAINNMSESQRVAFLMHRIDGKKYAEIAEALQISVKAVEKRMHLALVELRKIFPKFK